MLLANVAGAKEIVRRLLPHAAERRRLRLRPGRRAAIMTAPEAIPRGRERLRALYGRYM